MALSGLEKILIVYSNFVLSTAAYQRRPQRPQEQERKEEGEEEVQTRGEAAYQKHKVYDYALSWYLDTNGII